MTEKAPASMGEEKVSQFEMTGNESADLDFTRGPEANLAGTPSVEDDETSIAAARAALENSEAWDTPEAHRRRFN